MADEERQGAESEEEDDDADEVNDSLTRTDVDAPRKPFQHGSEGPGEE